MTTQTQSYFEDPLGRRKQVIPFGNSSANAVDYIYGSESPGFSTNTYRFVQVDDEQGTVQKDYFDKSGNLAGRIAAIGTSDDITMEYEYDTLDNLESITDPNGFVSTNEYNTLGRLISTTTPDKGTSKYIYGDSGNLRYSQDENLRTGNDFMVYYYDEFNRLVHEGIETDQSFNWTTTFPSTSDTTYGKEADEWRIKRYYDQDFVGSGPNFARGRLTMTETNDDNDDDPDHITRYVHDRDGNIIEKHVTIDEGNNLSEKVFKYQYDRLGREVLTVYPSGLTVANTYDAAGRLKSVSVIE